MVILRVNTYWAFTMCQTLHISTLHNNTVWDRCSYYTSFIEGKNRGAGRLSNMSKDTQVIKGGTMIQFQAAGPRAHTLNHSAKLLLLSSWMRRKGIKHPSVLLLLLFLCEQTLAIMNIYLIWDENKVYQLPNHFIHTLSLPVTSLQHSQSIFSSGDN